MAKDEQIKLRVSGEFKAAVKRLAEKDNRTVSSYIETLLKREIEKDQA